MASKTKGMEDSKISVRITRPNGMEQIEISGAEFDAKELNHFLNNCEPVLENSKGYGHYQGTLVEIIDSNGHFIRCHPKHDIVQQLMSEPRNYSENKPVHQWVSISEYPETIRISGHAEAEAAGTSKNVSQLQTRQLGPRSSIELPEHLRELSCVSRSSIELPEHLRELSCVTTFKESSIRATKPVKLWDGNSSSRSVFFFSNQQCKSEFLQSSNPTISPIDIFDPSRFETGEKKPGLSIRAIMNPPPKEDSRAIVCVVQKQEKKLASSFVHKQLETTQKLLSREDVITLEDCTRQNRNLNSCHNDQSSLKKQDRHEVMECQQLWNQFISIIESAKRSSITDEQYKEMKERYNTKLLAEFAKGTVDGTIDSLLSIPTLAISAYQILSTPEQSWNSFKKFISGKYKEVQSLKEDDINNFVEKVILQIKNTPKEQLAGIAGHTFGLFIAGPLAQAKGLSKAAQLANQMKEGFRIATLSAAIELKVANHSISLETLKKVTKMDPHVGKALLESVPSISSLEYLNSVAISEKSIVALISAESFLQSLVPLHKRELIHAARGDFLRVQGETYFKSGMHTTQGLENFLKKVENKNTKVINVTELPKRNDTQNVYIRRMENGVKKVLLPHSLLHKVRQSGSDRPITVFPFGYEGLLKAGGKVYLQVLNEYDSKIETLLNAVQNKKLKRGMEVVKTWEERSGLKKAEIKLDTSISINGVDFSVRSYLELIGGENPQLIMKTLFPTVP
jgi:hypothetical protein